MKGFYFVLTKNKLSKNKIRSGIKQTHTLKCTLTPETLENSRDSVYVIFVFDDLCRMKMVCVFKPNTHTNGIILLFSLSIF